MDELSDLIRTKNVSTPSTKELRRRKEMKIRARKKRMKMKRKNEKGETVTLTVTPALYCCFRIFVFVIDLFLPNN